MATAGGGGGSSGASTTSAEPAYILGSAGVSGVTHNNCSISVRGHIISRSDQKETPPNTHFIPALLCPSSCFPAARTLRGCQLICSLWVFRSLKVWYFFFGFYFFISMIEDSNHVTQTATFFPFLYSGFLFCHINPYVLVVCVCACVWVCVLTNRVRTFRDIF